MSPTENPAISETVSTPISPANFRVLLVDDNVDANESMTALLDILGYAVQTASDGPTALAASARFMPHLILCDIGLPGMNGYELAGALRSASGSRNMVLAAATGYGHDSDRIRSKAAGFDHHLVKPIDADALLEFIAHQAATYRPERHIG